MVVDDHAVLREGICALLAQHPEMSVVGEAANGVEALDKAEKLQPDIILMDISMPVMDGLEATRQLKCRFPGMRVLVLTQHENKEYVMPLLKAGASGYILKRAGGAELVNAIRAVFTEGAYLPPSIAAAVVNQVGTATEPQRQKLTDREIQVLRLIAEGLTGREIADKLCLSEKTVNIHRNNIMEKLDLHHVADLVRYAIREGLIQP